MQLQVKALRWALQRLGLGKVNEALLIHRAAQLGFVEEGVAAGTGHSLYSGKKLTGVKHGPLRGSGVGFRPTFAHRTFSGLV